MSSGSFALSALKERLKGHEVPSWAEYLPCKLYASTYRQPGSALSFAVQSGGLPDVLGQVWEMSQDASGCRDVQLFLESTSEEALIAVARVARELHGHVLEAVRCPHANHVLQKLISCVNSCHVQFVVDELMASPGAAEFTARHKYGCRIVQRILESCEASQVRNLSAALLVDACALAQHPYGNYVVQKLIEHGSLQLKRSLASRLVDSVDILCRNAFSSAVMKSALTLLPKDEVQALARAMLHTQGLLAFLARDRRCGNAVLGLLLQVLKGDDLKLANQWLAKERGSMRPQRQQRRASNKEEVLPSVLKIADFLDDRAKAYNAGA
eukprot:TRINITY_DN4207_c1_g1_i2.p1 TRINITY_DN4207_c1_g1~~TRINITY_DN4207_c1_g1_i2.p1  ORF type:complete len:372 (+),score=78.78 TRINITY_DN4207_c1_g1_i2:140-1117(+)